MRLLLALFLAVEASEQGKGKVKGSEALTPPTASPTGTPLDLDYGWRLKENLKYVANGPPEWSMTEVYPCDWPGVRCFGHNMSLSILVDLTDIDEEYRLVGSLWDGVPWPEEMDALVVNPALGGVVNSEMLPTGLQVFIADGCHKLRTRGVFDANRFEQLRAMRVRGADFATELKLSRRQWGFRNLTDFVFAEMPGVTGDFDLGRLEWTPVSRIDISGTSLGGTMDLRELANDVTLLNVSGCNFEGVLNLTPLKQRNFETIPLQLDLSGNDFDEIITGDFKGLEDLTVTAEAPLLCGCTSSSHSHEVITCQGLKCLDECLVVCPGAPTPSPSRKPTEGVKKSGGGGSSSGGGTDVTTLVLILGFVFVCCGGAAGMALRKMREQNSSRAGHQFIGGNRRAPRGPIVRPMAVAGEESATMTSGGDSKDSRESSPTASFGLETERPLTLSGNGAGDKRGKAKKKRKESPKRKAPRRPQ